MNQFTKYFLNKNTLYDLAMLTIGSILWDVAIIAFIVPNGLLSGGFTGICIILNNFMPFIPISISVYLLNVPFVLWALKELNKRFMIYTVYTLTLQSILLEVMANMPTYTGDIFLAVIFAGVLAGVGSGLVIRRNGSGGGTDIIGVIIKKKWGYSVGTVGLIFNVFVLSLCTFLYGIEIAMYTIIFIAICSAATDKAIEGLQKKYTAMIVTRRPELLKNAIFDKLHRGVTFLKGKGAFSGDPKDVVYCAINQYELATLKNIVYSLDPDVFMTITETTEIYGHFRNRHKEDAMLTAAEMEHKVVNNALEPITAVKNDDDAIVDVIDKDHEVVEKKKIHNDIAD